MVVIFRLGINTLEVDGVIFEQNARGIYEAVDPNFRDLNVFNPYIVSFLEQERIDLKREWNESVDDLMQEMGIPYELN